MILIIMILICIFVCGIVGISYPMKGDVLTPSPFSFSASFNSTIMRENYQKHGLCHIELYKRYDGMKQRCFNKNNTYYHNYGGRGIKVCDEWRNDFKAFYDHVIALPDYNLNLTIDRINNDGNYEPGNLRWVDRYTQMHNTRLFKTNKSGYKNVYYDCVNNKWRAIVEYKKKKFNGGRFKLKEDAINDRNRIIIENNLPIKLS